MSSTAARFASFWTAIDRATRLARKSDNARGVVPVFVLSLAVVSFGSVREVSVYKTGGVKFSYDARLASTTLVASTRADAAPRTHFDRGVAVVDALDSA